MKNKKIIYAIAATFISIVALVAIAWRYYSIFLAKPSFVLVYSKSSRIENIEKDIFFLKKKNYRFIGAGELGQILKNGGGVPSQTAIIVIHNLPSEQLMIFLNGENIPATFLVNPGEAERANLKRLQGASFGLRPHFPPPKKEDFSKGYISINFDDAWKSVYENALPVMKEARLPVTVNVITKTVIDNERKYVTADQIEELQDEGWEIASHSYYHEHFNKISSSEAEYSLSASRGFLEGLGLSIRGFAFPYDDYTADTLVMAKNYYEYLRFANDRYNPIGDQATVDGFTLKSSSDLKWLRSKIEGAKTKGAGLVLIFHEVSDNNRLYAVKPSIFVDMISLIKESGLPVFSNIGKLGKPDFLRRENGKVIEDEIDYENRLSQLFKTQKDYLERHKMKADCIFYPEGVMTKGLRKAAQAAGFALGFSGKTGFIDGKPDPLGLRTIIVNQRPIEKIFKENKL